MSDFKTVLSFFKKKKSGRLTGCGFFHRPPRFSFGGKITTRRGAQRRPLVHIWFDSGWAEPSVQLVISFPSISSSWLISSFHSPFSSFSTQHVTNERTNLVVPRKTVCVYIYYPDMYGWRARVSRVDGERERYVYYKYMYK